ncbi:pr1-like protein [Oryza sativa Japonica Group]|uniref:Pr1-like protein n=1 Tax=Oryza sativa subsp. japonica TaxID=39947 RepID=Q655D9_ORYSJ|nr:pr1-like protein [Oryza sativa Japonica Group]
MVAGGGHRHGGAAAERGEGKGEKKRRSTAHPGSTATTEMATGAEEGGDAARVDGVDGAPVVGERNGGVDEVAGDAAKPKEAAPRGEVVRGDNGGGPELGGDDGERGRRRELDSGGERERRVAETVEGGTGRVYIGSGGGESGRTRGKQARKIRPPLMAPARARARRRERREDRDDRWAPPVSEGGGRARPSAARARGEAEWAAGRRREREGDGPSRPKREKGEKGLFRAFLFIKSF